ncbi:hypothetical protein EYF80_000797 [Liparis tanakae]|uniref:Uncharacterized protein n=1 Tax=Liparis tanakae TaxID=230148 RepID=A0A4Z2JF88_9TELE|nr:hypothetical protein EYF80_000797 [Liparis tanakae]
MGVPGMPFAWTCSLSLPTVPSSSRELWVPSVTASAGSDSAGSPSPPDSLVSEQRFVGSKQCPVRMIEQGGVDLPSGAGVEGVDGVDGTVLLGVGEVTAPLASWDGPLAGGWTWAWSWGESGSTGGRTAWFSMRAKMTLSICVSVALAVVWLMRFLLAR